jgi:itaconate CoA-transferase
MGLSFEALHEQYPKLIVCDISGYGEGGPYEKKKAYDLLIQSESGFLSVTGSPGEPAKAGCSMSDIAAAMYAYSGILNALLLRGKTGEGSRVDVSMLESTVEWMSFPMYYAFEGAEPPPLAGAAHATIFPYGPFPVGDGNTIMLGLQNEREWLIFCEQLMEQPALGQDPAFSSNPKRVANREQLRALIVERFSQMTIDEVTDRLEKAQIANARVNDMKAVWAHPQLAARQRWSAVQSPVGRLPALLPPGTNSAFDAQMAPIPALGEHTHKILTELGMSEAQITELQSEGVI